MALDRAGIGRAKPIVRVLDAAGSQLEPDTLEVELLRGSLQRLDLLVAHDSRGCPAAANVAGVSLVPGAVEVGFITTLRTAFPEFLASLGCIDGEVVPEDRSIYLFGISMVPAVEWATLSGEATRVSTGATADLYSEPKSVALGGLVPYQKSLSLSIDATAAESTLASGVHDTTLTIEYRPENNYLGGTTDWEAEPLCGGPFRPTQNIEISKICHTVRTLEIPVRLKVVQPSYFLMLAPTRLDVEMQAGSSANYTFQLYNAMPGALDWHIPCADLPTVAGEIRLRVDPAVVPCSPGEPSGELEFQGEGSLTVSVSAPDIVRDDPYTYTLTIPATNENGATIVRTLPIAVTVVAEMLASRTLTLLDIPTSVRAGQPMVVGVQAKDQFDNPILIAGLSFSMDVTAAEPQNPWVSARSFLSRFTIDGYIIETDSIPQQGGYSLTVTNADNQETVLNGGSDDTFEIQVDPIACPGANVGADESGLVCVCSPGYGRGTDANGLQVCVRCTETAAGSSGTLYSSSITAGECIPCPDGTRPNADQSACDACPPGQAGIGGMCSACDAGKIPDGDGQICEVCQAGKQPTAQQTLCENCLPGFATDVGDCRQCDAGKRPVAGGSRCEVCPAGTQPNEGQSDCVQCAAGNATTTGDCTACITGSVPLPDEAGQSQARCQMCPSGREANADQSDCVDCDSGWAASTGVCQECDAGKRPVAGGSRCEVCPAGTQPNEGQSDCVPCALGRATTTGYCQICGPGTFTDENQGSCVVCDAGKQPSGTHDTCIECDAGKATAFPANTGICEQCASGKIPQDGQTRCGECASGTQPGPEGTTCDDCPPGSATTRAGICSPCDEGKIPVESSSRCEICPPGKEQGQNRTVCVQCELGEATVTGRCSTCARGAITVHDQRDCEMCESGKQPAANLSACEDCPPGSASSTGQCVPCSAGQIPDSTVNADNRTLPNHICRTCVRGSVTVDRIACEVCPAGKSPNSDETPTLCVACTAGKFRPRDVTACEACPLGKAPNENKTDCEVCPPGSAGAAGYCEVCPKGKIPDASQRQCEKCPSDSTTLQAGATKCICENNYFDNATFDGSSDRALPNCEQCPYGAVCDGLSNSIYAKAGFWINVYQYVVGSSTSTSNANSNPWPYSSINPEPFKPVHCLSKKTCIGYCDHLKYSSTDITADDIQEALDRNECQRGPNVGPDPYVQLDPPNACRDGSTGPLCAYCQDGENGRLDLEYTKVEGSCVKCSHFDVKSFVTTYGMYLLMCMFFLFKSRRIITGRDCDIHNSSCIIGISLFFVQTMVLLPSSTFGDLGFVTELAAAVSMSPDTADQSDGKCVSTGKFYIDWLLKFSIPAYNICTTVLVVLLAGLWKTAPWQGKMALFFAVQSSLFAINLRAISLFYCRTDLVPSCGDDCSTWLPVGHLKVDPSQSCTDDAHRIYLTVAVLIFAIFAFALPGLLCKQIATRMDAHSKLLRIEAYLKFGFDQGAAVLQTKDWSESHSAEYAARDFLSVIYYPLRRQRYWWAVVWIVRPTAIATVYNARNRGTGVAFGLADWRILVVLLLMLYNCLQASVQPFKHLNESQLDSFSVLLLMSLFTVSINNDFVAVVDSSLKAQTDFVAKVMTVVLVCLVVLATAQSKSRTAANIKRMIARDRWKSAWAHMSGDDCDPLADVGKLVNDLEIDANKKTGVLAKLGQIGIASVKLPVFEQIDVDESGTISLHEFLDWWTIRTIRTGMADEMREVAAELFTKFDADRSGEVDRDEFNEILTGLRDWHTAQKALLSKLDEPLEDRRQRIRLEREKVAANLHRHGWTEVIGLGWIRPQALQLQPAGAINPLAASFEVESPASAVPAALSSASTQKTAGVPTVEEIFACIDIDRSGSVSFHEFSEWWTGHGGAGSALELAKRAFDLVTRRDGAPGVSMHGLKDIMIAVAANGWQKATDPASGRQYFVNPANGKSSWLAPGIDAVEAFLVMAGISPEASTVTVYTPTLTEIFDEIDENGSGEIDFDEFADWWERNGGSQVSLAMAQEAFCLIEMRDGTPGLGFDELKEVMVALASDDWEEAFDQATGRKYFIDPHSKATTWLVPGVEIVGPFLERTGITRHGIRPAARTRAAARGLTNRRQPVDQKPASHPVSRQHLKPYAADVSVTERTRDVPQPQPTLANQHHVKPYAAAGRVERRTGEVSEPSGGHPARMHARMVDQVIATLDTAGTGQIHQSSFVAWWAEHQAPSLPVLEKLKFSRPISKSFATNSGTLSTSQFRELLLASFDEALFVRL